MKVKTRRPLLFLSCRLPIFSFTAKYHIEGRTYQKAINRRRYYEGTQINYIHN